MEITEDMLEWYEDFNDNSSRWRTGVNSHGAGATIWESKYVLDNTHSNRVMTTTRRMKLDISKPFRVDVELTFMAGKGDRLYGFIFGANENFTSYNIFLISKSVYFKIISVDKGEMWDICDFTETSYLNQGVELSSIIGLQHFFENGREYCEFLIDNNVVHRTQDVSLYGQYFGYFVPEGCILTSEFMAFRYHPIIAK